MSRKYLNAAQAQHSLMLPMSIAAALEDQPIIAQSNTGGICHYTYKVM